MLATPIVYVINNDHAGAVFVVNSGQQQFEPVQQGLSG
jgi:hypothetical protein